MILCPIAIAVGCKRCPAFTVCPLKSVIGNYRKEEETQTNENEPVLTRKPCEELKAEIAAKIQANGVETYTLGIVPNEELKDDDKVVGSCDGGTKKITYKRG